MEDRMNAKNMRAFFPKMLLVISLVYLMAFQRSHFTTSDEGPYYTTTRMLALNGSFTFTDEYLERYGEIQFIPASYINTIDGRIIMYAPPGNSIIRVPLFLVLKETGIFLSTILFDLLIIFLVYYYAKQILGGGAAKLSSILLLTNPLFYIYANSIMSDIPSVLFTLLSVFFLERYLTSKRSTLLALSTVSLGVSIWVRYTNMLFIPAILVYIILKRKEVRSSHILMALTAFLVILMPLLYYHHAFFGSAFKTGYSYYYEETGKYPDETMGPDLNRLFTYYQGFMLYIPASFLIALGLLLYYGRDRNRAIFFTLILACFIAFYLRWTEILPPGHWYVIRAMRYLLPTLPYLTVMMAYSLSKLYDSLDKKAITAFIVLIVLVNVGIGLTYKIRAADTIGKSQEFVSFVRENTGEKAVIATVAFNSIVHALAERSVILCKGDESDTLLVDRLLSDSIPVYYIPSDDMELECHGFDRYEMTDFALNDMHLYRIERVKET